MTFPTFNEYYCALDVLKQLELKARMFGLSEQDAREYIKLKERVTNFEILNTKQPNNDTDTKGDCQN